MKGKVILWAITVALGGFLFGFDTAVISGAEQSIQTLWQLTDFQLGLTVSIALYGTVIGALFGGIPSDRFGRKKTLFWIAVLYLVSALGSALAPEWYSFVFFRFIGGLGVGASSVAAPMYISEIAPKESRGQLVALFQFNIVLGILIAYLSNFLIAYLMSEPSWRLMLGVEAVPALIFMIMVLFVPRSPRWLIVERSNEEEARNVMRQIGLTEPVIDEAITSIKASILVEQSGRREGFFSGKFNFPIMLAFLIAFFNQMSGINAIIYYAPRIFEMAGLETSSALLSAAGIGVVNLVFTMIGISLIDRIGRKTLMYIGSAGYLISLALVSRAFYTESFEGVPFFLFLFIAAHAIGQGAVIWVFISEIFPNQVRAAGQSLGSFTHWILAAVIANVFPYFAGAYGGGPIFAFFCLMMFLQLLFVWRLMPETKGRSLEELEEELAR